MRNEKRYTKRTTGCKWLLRTRYYNTGDVQAGEPTITSDHSACGWRSVSNEYFDEYIDIFDSRGAAEANIIDYEKRFKSHFSAIGRPAKSYKVLSRISFADNRMEIWPPLESMESPDTQSVTKKYRDYEDHIDYFRSLGDVDEYISECKGQYSCKVIAGMSNDKQERKI